MDGLVTVKISDLEEIFNQLQELRKEVKELKEQEENTTAYSLEQVGQKLNLNYYTIRRLVVKGKLFAKYLNDARGKCVVPHWALKAFLSQKENSNQ